MSAHVPTTRWLLSLVLLVAGLGLATAASATDEGEIKGLFLYNLAKYVSWPEGSFASDTSPIVIGIVGAPDFAEALDTLVDGHKAQGRSIRVLELAAGQSASGVHVVYFPNGSQSDIRAQAAKFDKEAAIRVADSKRFARHGDIGIVMRDGRISFYVNGDNSRRGGMKVSSKLMRLASGVE